MQIQGIKKFDEKIREGLLLGKYNLEDYTTFLKSIPDLLSGKKALAIGHFRDGREFWRHGEIDKTPSTEEISKYNTYTYHSFEEYFSPFSLEVSPNIRKRMVPEYKYEKLCIVDVREDQIFSSDMQERVKVNPNIKRVGDFGFQGELYSDSSGIMFVGEQRITIKDQPELSAKDISADLGEISREGLPRKAQEYFTDLVDDKKDKEEEKSEE